MISILLFNVGCSQKKPKVIVKTVNKCSEVLVIDNTKIGKLPTFTLTGALTTSKDVIITKEVFSGLKEYISKLKLNIERYTLKTEFYEDQITKFNKGNNDDRK